MEKLTVIYDAPDDHDEPKPPILPPQK